MQRLAGFVNFSLISLVPEHAGGNRTEGGGLIGALSPQGKPAAGGQGSHKGRGGAAVGEAEDPQGEPPGAAESAARQAAPHPGEAAAVDAASLHVAGLASEHGTPKGDSWGMIRTYVHTCFAQSGIGFQIGFVRTI